MTLVRGLGWRKCSVLLLAHAIACSDDGVPATSDDPSDGGTTGTASMGGTDPSTMTGTTAETSVSDTSPESSGPVTATTSDDTTGTATSPTETSQDTSATDTSATETDTDATTGGPSEPCAAPSECQIVDNCCECTAIPADAEPAACEENCEQSMCDALGIDPIAACELGSCELQPVPCSAFDVACDENPPECPEGTLPSVDPDTMCWSGQCVPAEYCDVVTSCEDCADDEVCVVNVAHLQTFFCSPIAEECNGVPTCDCMGEQVCEDPFSICNEDGGGIQCVCPVC